jgi:hypothetical protein
MLAEFRQTKVFREHRVYAFIGIYTPAVHAVRFRGCTEYISFNASQASSLVAVRANELCS